MEKSNCQYGFFNCHSVKDAPRVAWFIASNVTNLCSPNAGFYPFGIYADAMTSKVTSSPFFNKYFYCLWWGLRNLRQVLWLIRYLSLLYLVVLYHYVEQNIMYSLLEAKKLI